MCQYLECFAEGEKLVGKTEHEFFLHQVIAPARRNCFEAIVRTGQLPEHGPGRVRIVAQIHDFHDGGFERLRRAGAITW